jgi:phage protein D
MSDNDDAIYVSAVPTAERIAKRVETRAINRIRDRIAKAGMKEEILRLAPSDDEVREEIDMMSLRELSLWIHHNGKRLEKAAKAAKAAAAAAEKQARAQHKAEKAAAAAAEKQAREQHKAEEAAAAAATITRVKARTLWTRFFNGVRKLNTIAVILEFKPKRKRKKSS